LCHQAWLDNDFCYGSLADNASMKAYMGSGFTPLVVQRNKALYFDIAERLTKQAQLYLNAQGEERINLSLLRVL
jgi:hypothetical protein